MKIKKTAKTTIKAPSGGATIADRFRLDVDDGAKKATPKSTTAAFFIALVALGVAGLLTFMLYKHWEFLMPA